MMDNNSLYKTPDQLPLMEQVGENTHALVEENGALKRVPGSMLGGGGIKTAIFKDSNYDNMLAGVAPAISEAPAYECTNMSFDEAMQTILRGEPLAAVGMFAYDMLVMIPGIAYFGSADGGATFFIGADFDMGGSTINLYWTADGVSTEMPGGQVSPD